MSALHHISPRADLTTILPVAEHAAGFKPKGLWYEVDGDWRRWCRGDSMDSWIDGRYLYELTLDPALRMLRLTTPAAIDRLTRKYAIGFAPEAPRRLRINIDWPRIAAEYDGIEIAPYQWSRRLGLNTTWYYGWDCASGCIWQPHGSSLTLLGPAELDPLTQQLDGI